MANRKISELTIATSSLDTDGLVIQRGGTNFKIEAVNFTGGSGMDTGSFVESSSISGTTITFTKADGTTYTNEIVSASYAVTASHEVTKEVSSSFADFATSASYAESASLAQLALETISSSYAISASHAEVSDEAISSSYAITASHATSLGGTLTNGTSVDAFSFDGSTDVTVDISTYSASVSTDRTALSASLTTTDQTISSSVASLSGSASDARNLIAGDLDTLSASFNERINSNDVDIAGLNAYSASLKTAIQLDGDSVTILGDMTVNGTQSIIHSTEVSIDDNILSLNGTGATNGGIQVNDPSGPQSGSLLWDGDNDRWIAGAEGSESPLLVADGMGILSSSAQIADEISGSITDTSASFSTSQTALSSSASDARNQLAADYIAADIALSASLTTTDQTISASVAALSASASTSREFYVSGSSISGFTQSLSLGNGTVYENYIESASYSVTASHALTASSVLHLEQDVFISGNLQQSGSINMHEFTINNLDTPTGSLQAANKDYVDDIKLDNQYDIFDLSTNPTYRSTAGPGDKCVLAVPFNSGSRSFIISQPNGTGNTTLLIKEFNRTTEVLGTANIDTISAQQFGRNFAPFISGSDNYIIANFYFGDFQLLKFANDTLTSVQTVAGSSGCAEQGSNKNFAQDPTDESKGVYVFGVQNSADYEIHRFNGGVFETTSTTITVGTTNKSQSASTHVVYLNGFYYFSVWNNTTNEHSVYKFDYDAETTEEIVTYPAQTSTNNNHRIASGLFLIAGKLFSAVGTPENPIIFYEVDPIAKTYNYITSSTYVGNSIGLEYYGEEDNENSHKVYLGTQGVPGADERMRPMVFDGIKYQLTDLDERTTGTDPGPPHFLVANSTLYPVVPAYNSNRIEVYKLDNNYNIGTTFVATNGNWKLSSEVNSSIQLPKGTTAERSILSSTGSLRFNTEDNSLEVKDTASWQSLATKNYVDSGGPYVKTVNGDVPDSAGNVAVSIAATSTGLSGSGGSDFPTSPDDADVYIISGETVTERTASNGELFIYSTASAQWYQITSPDQTSNDVRYVQVTGDTMTDTLTINKTGDSVADGDLPLSIIGTGLVIGDRLGDTRTFPNGQVVQFRDYGKNHWVIRSSGSLSLEQNSGGGEDGAYITLPSVGKDIQFAGKLTNVVDPTNAQDAATKAYVDNLVGDSGTILVTSFSNGWVNYGGTFDDAGYRKIGKQVYISGLVKDGTYGASTTIFNLPVGYRPTSRLILAVAGSDGSGGGAVVTQRMDINTNGDVYMVDNGGGTNGFVSLTTAFTIA